MKESAYKKAIEAKKKKQNDEFMETVAMHLSIHQKLNESMEPLKKSRPLESDVDTYKLFTNPD